MKLNDGSSLRLGSTLGTGLLLASLLTSPAYAGDKVTEPVYPACEKAPIVDAAAAERHARCLFTPVSSICVGSGEYRYQVLRKAQTWEVASKPANPACSTHTVVFEAADGRLLRMSTSR